MKRAIVIGASGYIGSHLTQELVENGYEVYVLQHRRKIRGGMETRVIKGGLSSIDAALVDKIRPDVIFHCARPTFSRFRRAGRIAAAYLAARLNRRLLNHLDEADVEPLLVFASGSLMYGNSPVPHDELSPLDPISYARQYYRGEAPLLDAIEGNTYPVMMLRFPWLIGNGSWFSWFYLDKVRRSQAIPGFGDMENKMEIIGVEEAAELMRKYSVEMRSTGVFNIPSAEPVTQREFAVEVARIFKVRIEDHSKIFPGKIEKEAYEAFTSNITLKTGYPEIIEKFPYLSLEELIRSASQQFNV